MSHESADDRATRTGWDIVHRAMVPLILCGALGCAQTRKPVQRSVFYPMLPQSPRVQFLTSITNETDIGAKRSALRQFVTGKKNTERGLGRPWDIAHEKGKLYVLDKDRESIVIIDLVRRKFDLLRSGTPVQMVGPSGISITPEGFKYVADKDQGKVLVFDAQDDFVRAYEVGDGSQPLDVAVYDDRLYVCDVKRDEVLALDIDSGAVTARIGARGQDPGQFRWPTHMAVDTAGNLYVTDLLNSRVQVFDDTGRFVRAIGEPGDFPGAMPRPKGIAVDRDGHLFVADAAFEFVQVFEVGTGEILMPFAKIGPGAGSSRLPAGVHIDYDNLEFFRQYADVGFRPEYLIYVCNQSGSAKLNVYAFGDWIEPGS